MMPSFKHDIGIISPDAWSSVAGAKVSKEVFKAMGILLKRRYNYLPVVSLLTTIAPSHKAKIISQIDPGDLSVIKILEGTTKVCPRVDARLRFVKVLDRLG
jgi:hypothetical protein